MGVQRLKRLTLVFDEKDQMKAKSQENCKYQCGKPLLASEKLQKNFRDAVKDHCHITGRYRRAAHSNCNKKLRINPKTDKIPVVFHNPAEGLRRAPFNASDVTAAAEKGGMHRQQHGEIHHIFSRRSAFHRQLELLARKP